MEVKSVTCDICGMKIDDVLLITNMSYSFRSDEISKSNFKILEQLKFLKNEFEDDEDFYSLDFDICIKCFVLYIANLKHKDFWTK